MISERENNVFIYWVGEEYKIIKFLRALIYHHSDKGKNYTIHLLNHENLSDYIDIIPEYFWNLSYPHQADFVRVEVIYKFGGIWLDSDTIVMSNLSSVFNILKEKEGLLIEDTTLKRKTLINGVFASRPGTRLMTEWKNLIHSTLLRKGPKIDWLEVGNEALQKIRYKHTRYLESYLILDGQQTVYPVAWNKIFTEFVEKPYDNWINIKKDFQPFIIITSDMYKKVEDWTEYEILNKTPISYFIKESYSIKYN